MKVLDYGAERKWQGLSALSVPLLPKPQLHRDRLSKDSKTSCQIELRKRKDAINRKDQEIKNLQGENSRLTNSLTNANQNLANSLQLTKSLKIALSIFLMSSLLPLILLAVIVSR